jgi:hypothetical protein
VAAEVEAALLPLLPLLVELQAAVSAARPALRTSAPAHLLTEPRFFIGYLFRRGAARQDPSAETAVRETIVYAHISQI